MKAKIDHFMAFLAARETAEALLLAYGESMSREGPNFRMPLALKGFRELADRLGFEVVEKRLEAAE